MLSVMTLARVLFKCGAPRRVHTRRGMVLARRLRRRLEGLRGFYPVFLGRVI